MLQTQIDVEGRAPLVAPGRDAEGKVAPSVARTREDAREVADGYVVCNQFFEAEALENIGLLQDRQLLE